MTKESARRPKVQKPQTVSLPIEDIVPDPDQPRKSFAPDGLGSLADSLLQTGQISPIVVRSASEGKYMIVAGERRWRAAKEAGLSHLECIIRYDVDKQKAREIQLAENYQREDIPVLEQAKGLKSYLDAYKLSQSELSRRTGIPQRTISARLALLKLPASMHARIESGEIGPYEAISIAALPPGQQETVAEAVASGRIGGRALEKLMHPQESPEGHQTAQQAAEPTMIADTAFARLSQKLEHLEKAIFELATIYAFNEAAKEAKAGSRIAPPCPECLKRGNKHPIWVVKRKMTPKDRREFIEAIEDAEEVSEEEKEEILEREPTHVKEAKCDECGYNKFLTYVYRSD